MARISPALLADDVTYMLLSDDDVEDAPSHEPALDAARGEIEARKFLAALSGNSITALHNAASQLGMLVKFRMMKYSRAVQLLHLNMELREYPGVLYARAKEFLDGGMSAPVELSDAFPVANDNNPKKERFQITWFDDVDQSPAKNEILEGVLGDGEFTLLVAKPGTAKSVLAGDIGGHIASGLDWHGRKVKQGLVVFFAAERKRLTERRIAAWRKHHGIENIPFVVVGGKLDLTNGLIDAKALAQTILELEIESGEKCVLIILDTVTRTFGQGDQHQSKDMGRYVQSVDEICRATSAHVLAIHHSPWNDDRGKGAIDLDGAIDASFVVEVKGNGPAKIFTFRCTGANDGEEGTITSFTLKGVLLSTDADGKETTAPVVIQSDPVPSPAPFDTTALKGNTAKAMDALKATIAHVGVPPPEGTPGVPENVACVSREDWRARYFTDAKTMDSKVEDGTLRQRFARAVESLTKGDAIGSMGQWFWVPVTS